MRFYMLNIDAAPLFDGMGEHLQANGFHQSDLLVNGGFTIASIKSMYAGKVYATIRPDDPSLIELLLEHGYDVEIHGVYFTFVRDILGEDDLVEEALPAARVRLRDAKPTLKQPQFADVVISMPSVTARRFRAWSDPVAYDAFMTNEAVCLEEIQSRAGDSLTHMTWSHYHDFVYGGHFDHEGDPLEYLEFLERTLVEWISLFDFDEEDSVFFIFSDHGDHVHRLTPPKDYLRWCFVKDNTSAPVVPRRLLSGIDVFATIVDKAGIPFDVSGHDCEPIGAPPDHDRIYHVADTRYWDKNRSAVALSLEKLSTHEPIAMSDLNLCMNATAVKAIDWSDEQTPARFLQATYYRHTAAYYFLLYEPNHEDPIYRYGFFDQGDPQMRQITSLDRGHPLRATVIELCESLVERFDWIENRDFVGQIDRGDFPEWMEP